MIKGAGGGGHQGSRALARLAARDPWPCMAADAAHLQPQLGAEASGALAPPGPPPPRLPSTLGWELAAAAMDRNHASRLQMALLGVEWVVPEEIAKVVKLRRDLHDRPSVEVSEMLRPVAESVLYVALYFARCPEMRRHTEWRMQAVRLLHSGLEYSLYVIRHSEAPAQHAHVHAVRLGGWHMVVCRDVAVAVKTAMLISVLLSFDEGAAGVGGCASLLAMNFASSLNDRYPGCVNQFCPGMPCGPMRCSSGDLDMEFALALNCLGREKNGPDTPDRLLNAMCAVACGILPAHGAATGMFARWVPTPDQAIHVQLAELANIRGGVAAAAAATALTAGVGAV